MPRFSRPDRTNRDASVQEVWLRLSLDDTTMDRVNGDLLNLEHDLSTGHVFPAMGCSHNLAVSLIHIALVARHENRSDNHVAMRKAFACFYWATELNLTCRRVYSVGDDLREDSLIQLLNWQGLSIACGLTWFADWTAPYIANLFRSGGVEKNSAEFSVDHSARFFVQTLQTIVATRQWPRLNDEQTAAAGPYAPLLVCAGDAKAFSVALTDYCDYRIAQCFGYADIDAVKRRRPSQIESWMDMASWGRVFPAELFTLQYAYQRATGQPLALDSEHPFLHTRLVTDPYPALEPLYEDEVTKKLVSLGASTFGVEWRLREAISMK